MPLKVNGHDCILNVICTISHLLWVITDSRMGFNDLGALFNVLTWTKNRWRRPPSSILVILSQNNNNCIISSIIIQEISVSYKRWHSVWRCDIQLFKLSGLGMSTDKTREHQWELRYALRSYTCHFWRGLLTKATTCCPWCCQTLKLFWSNP